MKKTITLTEAGLSLVDLRAIYFEKPSLEISSNLKAAIEKSAAVVTQAMQEGRIVYGINTGFGALATTLIPSDKLAELQFNIIRSHKAGVGKYLDENISRLILAIKIVGLSMGYSGVRWILIEKLLALYTAGYYPCMHSKGSVGASGDLAPLADLAGVLIGEGDAWFQGKIISAKEVLKQLGWKPYELGPKEGLSLINGTQVSTGLALAALFKAEHLFGATVVSGMLSLEAIKGSHSPFHPEIQRLRRQKGQQLVAGWYRELLKKEETVCSDFKLAEADERQGAGGAQPQSVQKVLEEASTDATQPVAAPVEFQGRAGKVQDPYCMRCQPVVMGACLDQLQHAADILCLEASGVTDNPFVIAETGEVISGGNFHAEPIAFAADNMALAIAEMASMAERRIALLMDLHFSGLPAFLVEKSGLHSGLMIAHVTAAAMVSENKSLAHPSSVDSIPTSANQEDHVSMATYGARRLHDMLENAGYVIGIELLASIRGLSFHQPCKTSPALEKILPRLRPLIQIDSSDHVLSPEIEALQQAALQGKVASIILEMEKQPHFQS